jgi:hypothetical protein
MVSEKTKKFLTKDPRQAHRTKTSIEELPLRMEYGSSTHHPERKGGMSTSDIKLWIKFLDGDWFMPYGGFSKSQILHMLDVCENDNQIVSIMELLSAKKQDV